MIESSTMTVLPIHPCAGNIMPTTANGPACNKSLEQLKFIANWQTTIQPRLTQLLIHLQQQNHVSSSIALAQVCPNVKHDMPRQRSLTKEHQHPSPPIPIPFFLTHPAPLFPPSSPNTDMDILACINGKQANDPSRASLPLGRSPSPALPRLLQPPRSPTQSPRAHVTRLGTRCSPSCTRSHQP